MFLPDGVYSLASVSAPSPVWSVFSSTARRPGSDRKCLDLANKVFCGHLGQEQCLGHLISRARLYLDLAREVDDVSAAAEIERRSQHEDWRLHSAAICHGRFTESTKRNTP